MGMTTRIIPLLTVTAGLLLGACADEQATTAPLTAPSSASVSASAPTNVVATVPTAASIEGVSWTMQSYRRAGVTTERDGTWEGHLSIAGSKLTVLTSCNTGGGTVDVQPGTLTFGPVESTQVGCGRAAAAAEAALLAIVSGTVSYTIEGSVLTVSRGDDTVMFRAAPTAAD